MLLNFAEFNGRLAFNEQEVLVMKNSYNTLVELQKKKSDPVVNDYEEMDEIKALFPMKKIEEVEEMKETLRSRTMRARIVSYF